MKEEKRNKTFKLPLDVHAFVISKYDGYQGSEAAYIIKLLRKEMAKEMASEIAGEMASEMAKKITKKMALEDKKKK